MEIIFTKHAISRIKRRKLTTQEVIDSIKNPDKTEKRKNLYYYQKRLEVGMIEICCEKTESLIKVITVYWM